MKISAAVLPPETGVSAKAKPRAGRPLLTPYLVARSHNWNVLRNSVCSKANPGRGKRQKGGQLVPNWGVKASYFHGVVGISFLFGSLLHRTRLPVSGSIQEPCRIIALIGSLEPL